MSPSTLTTVFIIGAVGLIGIGAAAMAFHFQFKGMIERLNNLEKIIERRRHTHSTIHGIEDATAVVIDMALEAEALKARADTALAYLGQIRQGPNSYKDKTPE